MRKWRRGNFDENYQCLELTHNNWKQTLAFTVLLIITWIWVSPIGTGKWWNGNLRWVRMRTIRRLNEWSDPIELHLQLCRPGRLRSAAVNWNWLFCMWPRFVQFSLFSAHVQREGVPGCFQLECRFPEVCMPSHHNQLRLRTNQRRVFGSKSIRESKHFN